MNNDIITDYTITEEVSLVTLTNIPFNTKLVSAVFTKIGVVGVNVDMISQTAPYKNSINLSFTISDNDFAKVLEVLGSIKKDVPDLTTVVNSNNCKISFYGEKMKAQTGVAAAIFRAMAKNEIDIVMITTSEVDVSILVNQKDLPVALESVKSEFSL